jgi:hypothetical protein
MWLPEEERRLLRIYYLAKKDHAHPYKVQLYKMADLCIVFGAAKRLKAAERAVGELLNTRWPPEMMKKLVNRTIVDAANDALEKRGLIELSRHDIRLDVEVSLTSQGYDLGRKYSWWFTRTGLHFAEYRNHWIMLVLGFLGGILGGILAPLLVERLKCN